MNICLMKYLDAAFGRTAVMLLAHPVAKSLSGDIRSLLLIRPGGIGDAALLMPAVNAVHACFPEATIDILAEKRNCAVFRLTTNIRDIFCYDCPGEFIRVTRNSYDVTIDTEQWHRLAAVVARSIPSQLKIGFDTNERNRMFTHPIPYSQDDYECDSFIRLLEPLGAGMLQESAAFLLVPAEAGKRAEALLKEVSACSFITIFPGASIPERRWGAERFQQVSDVLSGVGVNTVVVGGKEDRQQADVIVGGGPGLNLAGLTTLSETAAIIQRSALLLSGDSGVLHIAVGLGVPTVSLFGPGRAKKWAPQGDRHIVINKGLSCSPCTTFGTTPPCPIDARCMRDITADEVVNAVTMLLTSVGTMPSSCCKRDWIEVKKG